MSIDGSGKNRRECSLKRAKEHVFSLGTKMKEEVDLQAVDFFYGNGTRVEDVIRSWIYLWMMRLLEFDKENPRLQIFFSI